MRRFTLTLLSASLFGMAGVASSAEIDVMTQNQYLGADIAPLIGAIGTPGFNDAVVTALEQIAANRSQERFKALAAEITKRRPHLVGLQEVWQFNCIPAVSQLPGLPPNYPCTDPSIAGAFQDHLIGTMAALGTTYDDVAVVENFAVQFFVIPLGSGTPQLPEGTVVPGIPFFVNGVPAFLQVMDRDVILARSDVIATKFAYPCSRVSADGCNYDVDLPLGPLGSVKRGFVAVDATVGTVDYRFVNTHLEVEESSSIPGIVQALQAVQLATTVLDPANTPLNRRLIIVGDMNSSPNDPPSSIPVSSPTPYMIFAGAGLYDDWLFRPGNASGLSCCQLENLSNQKSLLTRRIDLVLSREVPRKVKDARLLGEVTADKTWPPGRGLWPSDHASVAAQLQY
jgi:endonuclease/exonuclease/phosphatase family metal-dependent hydrolase